MEGDPQTYFIKLAAELESIGRTLQHLGVVGGLLPRARRLLADSTTFVSHQLLEGDAGRVRARIEEAVAIATDESVGLTQLLERSIQELLAYCWWLGEREPRAEHLRLVAASAAPILAKDLAPDREQRASA